MGRREKRYATPEEWIERLYQRGKRQELTGQTKLKHYHATKDKMVACEICGIDGVMLHRHRIIPHGEYTDDNVVIVCPLCHKLIHRILKELGGKDYRLAVEFARQEKGFYRG